MADTLPPVPNSAPPPTAGPGAPSAVPSVPAGAAEAQQQIDAIYSDKNHAYHRGDKRATEEVFKLHRVIYGDAPVPGGPPLGPDRDAALKGPVEHQSLQAFSEGFAAAGVPPEFAQAIVDVATGFKSDLPPIPAGFVPMTPEAGLAALEGLEGPTQAQVTLAKARRVVDVLKSLGPDVQDRLEHALGASGAGNIPGILRQFARLHDLGPDDARRIVAQTFGGPAADRLFGPAPRR